MVVLIICGLPCSGKSTISYRISEHYKNEFQKSVKIISENDDLNLEREELFNNSRLEMTVRSSLKNSVSQLINSYEILILDSMSYIKSFRYEIFCLCKAQKRPLVLIYCDVDLETAISWNEKRKSESCENDICKSYYKEETIKAVHQRFEFPNPEDRWDKNIIIVKNDLSIDFQKLDSFVLVKKDIKPNNSTRKVNIVEKKVSEDQITQEITKYILENQMAGSIRIPDLVECDFPAKNFNAHSLRAHRTKFLTLNRHKASNDRSEVARLFIEYLKHVTDVD